MSGFPTRLTARAQTVLFYATMLTYPLVTKDTMAFRGGGLELSFVSRRFAARKPVLHWSHGRGLYEGHATSPPLFLTRFTEFKKTLCIVFLLVFLDFVYYARGQSFFFLDEMHFV